MCLACAVPLQVPDRLVCNRLLCTSSLWPLMHCMLLLHGPTHTLPLQHGLLHWLGQRLTPEQQQLLLLLMLLMLLVLSPVIALSLQVGRRALTAALRLRVLV